MGVCGVVVGVEWGSICCVVVGVIVVGWSGGQGTVVRYACMVLVLVEGLGVVGFGWFEWLCGFFVGCKETSEA